jgi:hypothetical protein
VLRGTAAWSSRWTLRLRLPVVLAFHQVPEGSPYGGDGGGDGVDPFRGAGGALASEDLARAALLQSQRTHGTETAMVSLTVTV